jgi:DnaJ-class molecular chaperone
MLSKCDDCNGDGTIETLIEDSMDPFGPEYASEPCPKCSGSGLSKEMTETLDHYEQTKTILKYKEGVIEKVVSQLKECIERLSKTPPADGDRSQEIDNAIVSVEEDLHEAVRLLEEDQ